MANALATRIYDAVPTVRDAYYKLILVVGPARSGKTVALVALAQEHNWPLLNVNLRLSEHLLDLTQQQRAVRVPTILDETVRAEASEVVLLDNIELLFATELAQDPLRLLQALSRHCTIIAAWPGTVDGTCLTYAEPGHPEARRYPTPRAMIVHVENAGRGGA
jgi:hypothetical protein